MASEPMELAKNWDPKHWKKVLPAYAQIKYDGVPLTFLRLTKDTDYQIVGQEEYTTFAGGTVVALTRQNEVAVSVEHLLLIADLVLLQPGGSFTAECFVPGKPFKFSSGVVRRNTPDADTASLRAVIFDSNIMARPLDSYMTRIHQLHTVMEPLKGQGFHVAPQKLVSTPEEVDLMWDVLQQLHAAVAKPGEPPLEGMMMHSLAKPFKPGKRCWGMARYKPQPTIDLEVVSFEEATSEAGEPLGMVGRVNVRLVRDWPGEAPAGWAIVSLMPNATRASKVVGVGPGKLSHEERTELWRTYGATGIARMVDKRYAEIKYMPDPSYEALRQPTVQRLRTDKTEGDILEY